MADQNPAELLAGMAGGAEGAAPAMPAAPQPSPTRNPKVMRLELKLTNELLSRRKREDLMPPESLMDTPNRVEFPILRSPREEFVPMPPAPMNFLDQMPGDLLGGMDAMVSEPEPMMGGLGAPGAMLDGVGAPVPGVGGEPSAVSDDPLLPPDGVDSGGF